MKRQILNMTLGLAGVLSLFAANGYASYVLAFSDSGSLGSVTTTGGSSSVNSFSGIAYNKLVVTDMSNFSSTSYNIIGGALTFTTAHVLTLTGKVTTLGGTALANLSSTSSMLMQFTFGGNLTNTGGTSSLNVSFNNPTSILESAILLGDLGITGPYTASAANGGGLVGTSGTPSGGNYTFPVTSDTFNSVITQTPEPVSFLLMGGGLLVFAGMRRNKSRQSV